MEPENTGSTNPICPNKDGICDHDLDPIAERVGCGEAFGTCYPIKFLTAEPSKFHDQTLIDATAKINETLAAIPPDTEGRRASIITNNVGVMLAWVHHGTRPEGNYTVSPRDDRETLIKALKLKM